MGGGAGRASGLSEKAVGSFWHCSLFLFVSYQFEG